MLPTVDDNNRIELSTIEGVPHSDYINASYVDVSVTANQGT